MQKIIIIGATSGIGLHLARLYAASGHLVGATGRRQDLLYALQLEFPNQIITECYDATGSQATDTLSRYPPLPPTAATRILLLTAQPKLSKALISKDSISRPKK